MGKKLLLVAVWLLPAVLVVLGINTGATIWYYMEPQMGSMPDPSTYFIAVVSGFVALALSVLVAVGISIYVATVSAAESGPR
ncbi:hypothetical protein FB472_2821 [Rhodoglobus vestalii]|uniref:Uncharacterized protein n=1 Tax=Rhodoglobus vestalii TaxID=193384 RepID=A0A8H2K6U6_9MICO|nr:hypothetical protein [Rhodoglobus vestalii]TQO21150.1 hypothetical protein FB472_2821 [Rhodoglobus vestalii]